MRRLDASAAGILLLVQDDGLFERTVTDGDLRRLLLQGHELGAFLSELPKTASFTLKENEYTKADALALMNAKTVNHVPIIDSAGNAVGLLSRKDVDEYVLLSTPHMGDAEREFVEEAFRTNWIAPLGPNVDAFERELADWVGIRHAAAVSSGTAAIHLALRLLDVGQGDIVFCSALTFVATANPIVYQGAEPVFIDSDPDSWNMSPVALESALKQARASGRLPKAVIIVNLYGQSADMDPLLSLCDQYGVPVIEDAAESLGATYKQRASGTFGRIGIFSFNGNKIITTSGGGMLVSDDESLVKKARFLATQAREPVPHYEHQTVGYNYRMSNLLAGVGRGQLKVLSDRVSARRQVFERYREALADLPAIEWMPEPAWSLSNRWLTTGTVQSRYTDVSALEFIKRLAAELIEARPVWKPMQLQPVFSGCRYFCHENESVSARLFETGFCLPSGSNMTERQQCRVIEAVRKILA
ncbi:aminotransferase class I/II-fold pyridoxal phosphate-dependent enzyme [Permianibacter sp. IMCC34836]|nr:aminotransferase class I/II-fold pyridoxal phosphate-dependent enzyme [Permianibacter fluminis]